MSAVGGLGELELIERIKPFLAKGGGGDDAAAWQQASGCTVASTDMAIEGAHFDLAWQSAEDAGWRALAIALGDLAAKGATPERILTSVAIPRTWEVEDLVSLFRGMHALASRLGAQIVGGDMGAIDGPAVLSLTLLGSADVEPIPRSAARPGWSVAVTGPLGAPAVALRERRALRLEPLIEEGRRLNRLRLCCGDISDGLVREMEKFLAMSGAGCVLRADAVPVAAGATLVDALTSGEEVQLVCTGPEELIRRAGLEPVGVLVADRSVTVAGAGGRPLDLQLHGYDHFA